MSIKTWRKETSKDEEISIFKVEDKLCEFWKESSKQTDPKVIFYEQRLWLVPKDLS